MSIDQRKIQIEMEFDASGVKPATESVKAAVRDMSTSVAQESQKASAGLAGIGAGAEQGAQKFDRATKSMISQIQRLTAETQAVSGKASERLTILADLKGVNKEAIAPYLAQLQAAEAAQARAAAGMNNLGLSAKQLQASMRGLPAQFTDIFTSLATGQAPITVLLQQGGQIKDMFGGIVPAAKAIGTAIMGLVNPFTLAAGAAVALAVAYNQGANEAQEFRKSIIETGNAAGVTVSKLQGMATGIAEGGPITKGKAAESLNEFIRAVRVGSTDLQRFTQAAIELERAGGQSVKKTAEAFADLGKDPLKATMKLNESMNYLSVTAYQQISSLEKVGKTAEAARVAQEEYFKAVSERGKALNENLGYIERGWTMIKDAAKWAWDAMLGIGRKDDPLAQISDKVRDLQKALTMSEGHGNLTPADRERMVKQLEVLREQQRNLQETERMQNRLAGMDSARLRQVEALDQIEKMRSETKPKEKKMEEEILRVKQMAVAAGLEEAKIQDIILAIREKYRDKSASSGAEDQRTMAKEWEKFYLESIKLTQKATSEQLKLNDAQELMVKFLTHPMFQAMPETWKQTVLQLLYAASAQEDVNAGIKEFEKIWKKVENSIDNSNEAYEKQTKVIVDQAKKLELEAAQLGLTADKQAELAIQVRETEIARLESLKTTDLVLLEGEKVIEDIDKRIAALRRLNDAERAKGAAEARQDILKDWKLTAEQISQSLTDALVKGFDSGKGFAKSVGDYIVNYFKTTVARAIATSLAGAISSVMTSAASAMGSGGGGGGSGGGGALNLMSSGGSFLSGMGSIPTMASLGGTFMSGLGLTMSGTGGVAGASIFSGTGLALEGAASMMGSGSMGSMLAGGAQALGAVMPYLAIAYGLYRIISGVGTGRARGPAYQEWATSGPMSNIFAGGINNPGGGSWQGGHYQAQVNAIASAVSAAAVALGGRANANTTYGLYSAQSPDGRGANTVSQVVGANSPGYYIARTGGNADVAQLFADTYPAMILAGLRDADLPAQIKDYLSKVNVTDQASLDAVIELTAAVTQMAEAFKQLGGPFEQLTTLTVEARAGILDMTGGLEQFIGKTSGYVNAFYSDEERQALSLASVNKTLTGVGIDTSQLKTTGDFRNLVESLDLSKEADQKKFAALMNSAESFAFGASLLGSTNMNLSQLTANAPITAGIDLMVTSQVTTNSLLERIEAAVQQSGAAVVEAIGAIEQAGGGGGGGTGEVNTLGGATGGGN